MSKEAKNKHEQEEQMQEAQAKEKEGKDQKLDPKGKNGKENKDQQVEELGQKLMEVNDKYLRLSAEFDNYRKRTLKEKMELTKNAGEELLQRILPVMDNFERAIKSIENSSDVPALRQGVELIYTNFKDFLIQNGVKEMECLHAEFDPETQEAITKIPAPSEDMKGKVIDCVQKGYTLHDKVIRYPKVVVGE